MTIVEQYQSKESFSEFYIKDSANLLKTNTLELVQNEKITLGVVVVNHEGTFSNYRIYFLVNGRQVLSVENFSLEDQESHEEQIEFSLPTADKNQRIDILLEKQGSSFPYRTLHLWANVVSGEDDLP